MTDAIYVANHQAPAGASVAITPANWRLVFRAHVH